MNVVQFVVSGTTGRFWFSAWFWGDGTFFRFLRDLLPLIDEFDF